MDVTGPTVRVPIFCRKVAIARRAVAELKGEREDEDAVAEMIYENTLRLYGARLVSVTEAMA